MPDDAGLALPKLQPHFSVPKADGLIGGTVSNGVADILRTAAHGDDLSVYNAVPKGSFKPTYQSFQGSGPDPLSHIDSVLEAAVGSDPSALGTAKAIVNAIFTGLGRPVATISDLLSKIANPSSIGGTLARIDDLQKNFFTRHQTDLGRLDANMGVALSAMRDLANLMTPDSMDKFHLSTGPLFAKLQDKQQLVAQLSNDLSDAIANEDDPDERGKLQSEKDQVDAWRHDCDKRLAQDENQLKDLQGRTNAVSRVAGGQSEALLNAAYGDHPTNETSDGAIVGTTHTQPKALAYASGLRSFLTQSRIQMNGAMAGQ